MEQLSLDHQELVVNFFSYPKDILIKKLIHLTEDPSYSQISIILFLIIQSGMINEFLPQLLSRVKKANISPYFYNTIQYFMTFDTWKILKEKRLLSKLPHQSLPLVYQSLRNRINLFIREKCVVRDDFIHIFSPLNAAYIIESFIKTSRPLPINVRLNEDYKMLDESSSRDFIAFALDQCRRVILLQQSQGSNRGLVIKQILHPILNIKPYNLLAALLPYFLLTKEKLNGSKNIKLGQNFVLPILKSTAELLYTKKVIFSEEELKNLLWK